MTAHAMKGDRERCIAAGMDGYIGKPVRFSDIEETLTSLNRVKSNPPAAPVRTESWSRNEALERIGGDEQLLGDLCKIFLDESPKLMAKLRQAIADGDYDGLMRAAHSLKGESSYLGAGGASQSARQLEEMGRNRDLSHADSTLAELEREISSLHDELKDLAGAQP
jgi:HPt (histidine-containing phosphotransfer) domain-containing protein